MGFDSDWHNLAQLRSALARAALGARVHSLAGLRTALALLLLTCSAALGCEHGGPHPEPPRANVGYPGNDAQNAGVGGHSAGTSTGGGPSGGMPSVSEGAAGGTSGAGPDPSGPATPGDPRCSDAGLADGGGADAGESDAGSDAGVPADCDQDAGD